MIGPRTNTTAAQMLGISGSGGQQIAPSAIGQPGGGGFLKGIGSFLGGTGGKIFGSLAAAGIPAYLGYKSAKKFQEEQEDPETIARRKRAVDPVGDAGERYFAMTLDERRSPEGQEAAAQAGIR